MSNKSAGEGALPQQSRHRLQNVRRLIIGPFGYPNPQPQVCDGPGK